MTSSFFCCLAVTVNSFEDNSAANANYCSSGAAANLCNIRSAWLYCFSPSTNPTHVGCDIKIPKGSKMSFDTSLGELTYDKRYVII